MLEPTSLLVLIGPSKLFLPCLTISFKKKSFHTLGYEKQSVDIIKTGLASTQLGLQVEFDPIPSMHLIRHRVFDRVNRYWKIDIEHQLQKKQYIVILFK
jgi:hypothetical protein